LRILLDSHVFLWALQDPKRLNQRAFNLIEDTDTEAFLSIASFWELSIKKGLGKLDLNWSAVERFLPAFEISELPVTRAHALEVGTLPRLHLDPFDRMLVAQARLENLTLATADPNVMAYDVETLACA